MLAPVGIGNRPMELCNIVTCNKHSIVGNYFCRLLDWILLRNSTFYPPSVSWHDMRARKCNPKVNRKYRTMWHLSPLSLPPVSLLHLLLWHHVQPTDGLAHQSHFFSSFGHGALASQRWGGADEGRRRCGVNSPAATANEVTARRLRGSPVRDGRRGRHDVNLVI